MAEPDTTATARWPGCCMTCNRWRYTQQGRGECMLLKIWTEEDFCCKSFYEGTWEPRDG